MIYALVIISFILGIGAELLHIPEIALPENYDPFMINLYSWLRIIATTLVLLQVFLLVPYNDMKLKSITFIHFCWGVFNCFTTAGIEPSYILYVPLILFQIFTFGSCILYRIFSTLELPNDKYNDKDCFIVFSKPVNFWPFVWCWFGMPVSSVSVVSKGIQFCYKRKKTFHAREYDPEDHHFYLKVPFSDSYVRKKLSKLYSVSNPEDDKAGREWSYTDNCCHAILRLYPNKITTILSFLPCVLAKQLIGYKYDK